MNNVKIEITPLSYLASSGNSGGPLIDIDVLYDIKTGVPYLNGKRVKGLLRESAREVLEILGKDDKYIDQWMSNVFGEGDRQRSNSAIKSAPNLYFHDWTNLKEELIRYQNNHPHAFTKENVLEFFTDQKMVTAVEENGIAKDKSLRTYRLIKPSTSDLNISFAGNYKIKLNQEDEDILNKACLNLRYMGTSRNRGLGKVKVTWKNLGKVEKEVTHNHSLGNRVKLSIVNDAPIIIANSSGDQNTVNTGDVINGSMIRGMLASEYLKNNPELKNAHLNAEFYNIFLSGNLHFAMGKPNGLSSVGLHIHKYKAHESKHFVNAFEKKDEDYYVSKPFGRRGHIEGNQIEALEIIKNLHFHNSRLERAAGRSTEHHSGIYYYESIAPGQLFECIVSGPKDLINKLFETIGTTFLSKIGKSKSVQYGNINVTAEDAPETKKSKENEDNINEYLIKINSPLITENAIHIPELSIHNVIQTLGFNDVEIVDAYCKKRFVEHYNIMWQSKSYKYLAYDEGSVIKVNSSNNVSGEYSIGLLSELGYGAVSIVKYNARKESPSILKSKVERSIEPNFEKSQYIVLNKIIDAHNQNETHNEIKLAAYKSADGLAANLTRSQLSRLKSILENKTTMDAYQLEFENKSDKKKGLINRELGKKLQQLFLYEEIKQLKLPIRLKNIVESEVESNTVFKLSKLYWLSAFRSALKTKKKD